MNNSMGLFKMFKQKPKTEIDVDDIIHITSISKEAQEVIKKRLERMEIRDVSYGLSTYSLDEYPKEYVERKRSLRDIKESGKPAIYISATCKFFDLTEDKCMSVNHRFVVLGINGSIYDIQLCTFVKYKFSSKFYDNDILAIASYIAQDIINQNHIDALTNMKISIPHINMINLTYRSKYSIDVLKFSNQSVDDSLEEIESEFCVPAIDFDEPILSEVTGYDLGYFEEKGEVKSSDFE